jgi:hypothetical protein
MPLGYNLGKTVYSFLPSYKSGTLITVGTDSTIFLRGILQNRPVRNIISSLKCLHYKQYKEYNLFLMSHSFSSELN